jgi:hypothetical protein
MSFPSYFYRCPPELGMNALEAGFQVTSYVQVENYRLITWTSTGAAGEILYRDRECLAATTGKIELLNPEAESSDPWADSFSSPLGIPLATIKSLQSQTPQVLPP